MNVELFRIPSTLLIGLWRMSIARVRSASSVVSIVAGKRMHADAPSEPGPFLNEPNPSSRAGDKLHVVHCLPGQPVDVLSVTGIGVPVERLPYKQQQKVHLDQARTNLAEKYSGRMAKAGVWLPLLSAAPRSQSRMSWQTSPSIHCTGRAYRTTVHVVPCCRSTTSSMCCVKKELHSEQALGTTLSAWQTR